MAFPVTPSPIHPRKNTAQEAIVSIRMQPSLQTWKFKAAASPTGKQAQLRTYVCPDRGVAQQRMATIYIEKLPI